MAERVAVWGFLIYFDLTKVFYSREKGLGIVGGPTVHVCQIRLN